MPEPIVTEVEVARYIPNMPAKTFPVNSLQDKFRLRTAVELTGEEMLLDRNAAIDAAVQRVADTVRAVLTAAQVIDGRPPEES